MATIPTVFPPLKTSRLILDQLSEEHKDQVADMIKHHVSRKSDDPLDLINDVNGQFEKGTCICWGMYLDGELIGSCGYYRGFDNECGEIGYVLRKPFRGKGYMSEAILAAMDYGFKTMGLDMVDAFTKDENGPSIKVLNSLGFKRTDEFHDDYRRYIFQARND